MQGINLYCGDPVRVSMKLEMKDAPGQLLGVLKPISEVGGNIIAILHQRDPESDSDVLGVQIVLDIPDTRLTDLKTRLLQHGVNILRVNEERLICTQTVILIGHLMHTDLGDTINSIDRTGFAEVTALTISMPAIEKPSSARFVIRALDRNSMGEALRILRNVAQGKNLILIEPLEDLV